MRNLIIIILLCLTSCRIFQKKNTEELIHIIQPQAIVIKLDQLPIINVSDLFGRNVNGKIYIKFYVNKYGEIISYEIVKIDIYDQSKNKITSLDFFPEKIKDKIERVILNLSFEITPDINKIDLNKQYRILPILIE
ncbi:hypothetical protein [Persicobacter psychrovividus]|uniref:TonB C-terminal domain-containing protein n=1 Tax=Persicobacter psychrovividus TaxID=387638 RepID=A0ABN6LBH6_9BACT|nr:hypothetical protein PEPS_13030 [Persicobacter psychrovividus]